MSAASALETSGLCVRRGGRRVVNDIALRLEPGTVTAICGPNGAGKSTLLEVMAGLVAPKGGMRPPVCRSGDYFDEKE